ncbi:MAG: hypothetical protein WA902_19985 [Thermosynechococcaceae cyanobacterium]
MTPTLFGRWQTRILLLETVGLVITLLFCTGILGPKSGLGPFWYLQYIVLFGIGWDILYHYLQQWRWDHDWPAAMQWMAAIWEWFFFVLMFGVAGLRLPGIDEFFLGWFTLHYGLVWVSVFFVSQSLMRLVFPQWRFRGGQWL